MASKHVKLRIEAALPQNRKALIKYVEKRGATNVRPSCSHRAFTCEVADIRKASDLLLDLKYEFPKAYYQGWTENS